MAGLLLAGVAQLAFQAFQASIPFAADVRNPYVYAQTSPDILNLVDRLDALAPTDTQKSQLVVKVMAPEGEYWPLALVLAPVQPGWFGRKCRPIPSHPS